MIVVGYSIAGWTGVGTNYSTDAALQWRLPLALQCLFPVLILALSPFIPESPRWCKSVC